MLASRVPQCNTIKGKTLGAAALLDRIDLLRDDPQIIQTTISSMFDAPDYHRLLSSFQGGTTQPPPKRAIKFVNALHKALGYDDGSLETKSKLRRALRETCAEVGILPSSDYLGNSQVEVNGTQSTFGEFSDLWRGSYKGENVSVKAFRVNKNNTENVEQLKKALCREVVVFQNLSHPNILPFLGVISTDSLPLRIVSKWMQNGNISDFLKRDGQFNRRPLLVDIARGLNYLHSRHVVHGSLKGSNILIDDNNNAVLCDFGLAPVTAHMESPHASASTSNSAGPNGGQLAVRWMAPELLSIGIMDPESVTKESDMYSLAMVVIEIFAGRPPFSESSDMTVIFKLARGERPKKPKEAVQLGLTDPIWATVEMCWKVQPSDRLTAAQVLKIWENEINGEGIPEAAEQRDHPTVAQVLEIQKETNGGSIPKEAEEGDRFAAVQTLEVQEEISGGIPKTTEQGERRRLRIVRGFRAPLLGGDLYVVVDQMNNVLNDLQTTLLSFICLEHGARGGERVASSLQGIIR